MSLKHLLLHNLFQEDYSFCGGCVRELMMVGNRSIFKVSNTPRIELSELLIKYIVIFLNFKQTSSLEVAQKFQNGKLSAKFVSIYEIVKCNRFIFPKEKVFTLWYLSKLHNLISTKNHIFTRNPIKEAFLCDIHHLTDLGRYYLSPGVHNVLEMKTLFFLNFSFFKL
jgi:hypothetical protein